MKRILPRGYGTLKASQLKVGTWYNWTAKHGRKVLFLGVQQLFPDDSALVLVEYKDRIYYAGSNQLYLAEMI